MERLTFDDLNKVCYDPWELCGMDSYCKKGCHEDGGCTKGCHILKMYRKLAEYEDMEEQGRIVKLPCVVGDKLFVINRNHTITEEKVYDVQFRGIKYEKGQRFFMNVGALGYFECDFDKTLFYNKEQAEQALQAFKQE